MRPIDTLSLVAPATAGSAATNEEASTTTTSFAEVINGDAKADEAEVSTNVQDDADNQESTSEEVETTQVLLSIVDADASNVAEFIATAESVPSELAQQSEEVANDAVIGVGDSQDAINTGNVVNTSAIDSVKQAVDANATVSETTNTTASSVGDNSDTVVGEIVGDDSFGQGDEAGNPELDEAIETGSGVAGANKQIEGQVGRETEADAIRPNTVADKVSGNANPQVSDSADKTVASDVKSPVDPNVVQEFAADSSVEAVSTVAPVDTSTESTASVEPSVQSVDIRQAASQSAQVGVPADAQIDVQVDGKVGTQTTVQANAQPGSPATSQIQLPTNSQDALQADVQATEPSVVLDGTQASVQAVTQATAQTTAQATAQTTANGQGTPANSPRVTSPADEAKTSDSIGEVTDDTDDSIVAETDPEFASLEEAFQNAVEQFNRESGKTPDQTPSPTLAANSQNQPQVLSDATFSHVADTTGHVGEAATSVGVNDAASFQSLNSSTSQTSAIARGPVADSFLNTSGVLTQVDAAEQAVAAIKNLVDSGEIDSSRTVSLELTPAELGHLAIRIEQTGDILTAQIVASEYLSSDLLQSQKETLVQSLADLGYENASVDISHREGGQSDSGQNSKEQGQQKYTTNDAGRSNPLRTQTGAASGLNIIA